MIVSVSTHLYKLAFVHIPRTAGFYVAHHLEKVTLRGYALFNSWEQGLDRDWTRAELDIIACAGAPAYVHNHLNGWSSDAAAKFRASGWKMFSFMRHPGDRLCSLYHYYLERNMPEVKGLTIADWIRQRLNWPAFPVFWRDLDFFSPFSDELFCGFLGELGYRYEPIAPINISSNEGFYHYVQTGTIPEDLVQAIEESENAAVFNEISRHPIRRFPW
jgi:hypothetical protein